MRIRPSRLLSLHGDLGRIGLCALVAFALSASAQNRALGGEEALPSTPVTGTARPRPAGRVQAAEAYGKLPLSFEANQGQTDPQVRFLSRGNGYSLFLASDEVVLALKKPGGGSQGAQGKSNVNARKIRIENRESATLGALRMRLVGANPAPQMKGIEELPGKSNYFIGNQPSQWHTNVPNYRKVAVSNVYSGIDLVYYGSQRQLEYDFVVSPGAEPRAIRLAFRGAKGLEIDSQGDLIVSVAGGEVRLQKPITYQEVGAVQHTVKARYVLKGTRQVAFQVGKYDRSRPLIIDPILEYSTYLGGSSIDGANAIAVAPDGTAFIAGGTFSSDFPTAHPLQPNAGGPPDFPQDAFVAKISADGSTLLYSTYLGGVNSDVGNGVAVDTFGNAYVTGTTLSPNFPVTPGSFNTLCGGDGKCGASWNPNGLLVSNAFVTKLNSAGSALVYSGFLGNYEIVKGLAIAVDSDLEAYVTGQTGPNLTPTVPIVPPATPPPPFPITIGAFQPAFGGGSTDAFVSKISASGATFLYSSYLGGSDEDIGYGIAAGSGGNAYVTGLTYSPSPSFPTTASALQPAYAGAGDAFLTQVDTSATGAASLIYSTYLGGSGLDQGNGMAVDASGNAYVAGVTTSIASTLGFTPPAGAFQPECALDALGVCEGDAFVSKLDPAQSGAASLVYFTYLGGALADSGNGIAVDTSSPPNIYVTGSTVSTDQCTPNPPCGFPIAGAVFQPKYGGGNADAFVAKLTPAGGGASDLVYSTYLGGSNTDTGAGIAVDTGNPASAYVAGQTCSLDFPLANPLQVNPGGNCDAFISKVSILEGIALNPGGLFFPTQSIGTKSAPETVTLTNGDNAQTIASIAITGADPGDFAETNTCPASLAAGVQCTITVIFTPSVAGIRKASVTITDSAPGSPQVVSLTGSTSTVGLSCGQDNLPCSGVSFGNQAVGIPSSSQAVTVTNNGTSALTISSVTASGDYSQTDNCTIASLQPTTTCVIKVTFAPSVPGRSVGALTLSDNAPGSPQVILLTGTGFSEPLVNLSTSTLGFPSQTVGTTSAPQQVTLQNIGSAPLNISGIGIAPSSDFSQTNTCGPSLSAGATCTLSVTFTPSAAGSRTASLTITDNAAGSPQVISLGGNGADFAISVSPPSATVTAGNSVSYTLMATPSFGFNAKVTLSCGGAPPLSTCSVSPASVTPDGTNAATATVTVTTAQRSLVPPGRGPHLNLPRPATRVAPAWLLWLLLLTTLATLAFLSRRRAWAGLGFALFLVLVWSACGAGGSPVGVPSGTPAGNYTLTLSGTSGTVNHTTTASLTVR